MSDFITDVEQQYEVYCKIAEEYGFTDLNAKKVGFRSTTKSAEFNAGWIAFTGAVAAVRDEQQAEIDELQKLVDEYEKLTTSIRNEFNLWTDGREFADVIEAQIENLEALRGEHE